jgi:YidC/Oxa1 family membrane protein insertase
VLETEVLVSDRVDPKEFSGAIEVKGPFKAKAWPAPDEVWPPVADQRPDRLVSGFGVHTRYFGALLKPEDPAALGAQGVELIGVRDKPEPTTAKGKTTQKEFGNHFTAVDFVLPRPAAGQTAELKFLFFAGPMDPDVLTEPPYDNFAPIVDYGWLGIPKLLLILLGVIHSVVGNWGVAIIFLTLVVRMAMFPLSRKSQVSMQKYSRQMARIKPKMDALKERYKGNRQKLNQEIAKLMREENVRMVPAGCLVMFIQFPIFIGLFQALRWSIDLRHAPFLWARDLTAPDRLFDLPNVDFFLVPDYFNLLPILMAITWFLSMAMAPKPVDPQQQQTQKMMKWMPIVFSVMLYNYAAGLSLYMVVSSTWSIFETKVVKKLLFKDEPAVAAGVPAPEFRKGK